MKKRSKQYIIQIAQNIQQISAPEAKTVAYIPQLMANTALPSRSHNINEFVRRNGNYELTLLAPSSIGLPYGTYPRLIISWITTQSKITKSNEIYLGRSLNEFIKNLGKTNSGGSTGSATALREQCKRLFSCSIQWTHDTESSWSMESLRIAQRASMLWNPNSTDKWEAYLTLDQAFFEDIQLRAVPIDHRVLEACSHYPLAIDVYCWQTYRYFKLTQRTLIPWKNLALQFANSYSRRWQFKNKFYLALKRVQLFYPAANFCCDKQGVWLYPSPPHVPPTYKPDSINSS